MNLFFKKLNVFVISGDSGGQSPGNVMDPLIVASRYVPSCASGVSDSVKSVYLIFSFKTLSLVWSNTAHFSCPLHQCMVIWPNLI